MYSCFNFQRSFKRRPILYSEALVVLINYEKTVVLSLLVKPGKPRNLQDSQKKTDSIRLSWDAPTSTGGGEISQYIINITDANSVSPREVTSKGTEKIIDNLMKGAEYTFSVAAENEAGLGDYSDSRKVTTYKYGKNICLGYYEF